MGSKFKSALILGQCKHCNKICRWDASRLYMHRNNLIHLTFFYIYRQLFTRDAVAPDTVQNLTKSRGGEDAYHEKYVEALQMVILRVGKLFKIIKASEYIYKYIYVCMFMWPKKF